MASSTLVHMTGGEQRYIPSDDEYGQQIYDAAREGLTPFKPRTINLYVESDPDYRRYVLFIEVWFPDYQLRHREDMNFDDLNANPDLEVHKAAVGTFNALRYRQSYAIGDNVVLGEE